MFYYFIFYYFPFPPPLPFLSYKEDCVTSVCGASIKVGYSYGKRRAEWPYPWTASGCTNPKHWALCELENVKYKLCCGPYVVIQCCVSGRLFLSIVFACALSRTRLSFALCGLPTPYDRTIFPYSHVVEYFSGIEVSTRRGKRIDVAFVVPTFSSSSSFFFSWQNPVDFIWIL